MIPMTLQSVNNFLLEKQHLAARTEPQSIETIAQDVAGLHATLGTTPYLSLLARNTEFLKDDLDHALYTTSSLVKVRCVRTTLHVHTQTMLPIVHRATSALVQNASRRYMQRRGIDAKTFAKLSASVLDLLKDEDKSAAAIKDALNLDVDVSALLYHMCDLTLLVRRSPARGWRDRSHRYGPFRKYYPDVDLEALSEAQASVELVRRYLAAFGPVREADLFWWTGLSKTEVRKALNAIREELLSLEVVGLEGAHIMLLSQYDRLKDMHTEPRGVIRLLPALDPYLMGYKVRTRYLDPQHADRVFDRSGNATSTVLLDGEVTGVWDFEADSQQMKLFLFDERPVQFQNTLNAQTMRLGRFLTDNDARVKICESMKPLTQRTAGGFMTPLKDG